jgi:para-aminobenzoate synthetase component 1
LAPRRAPRLERGVRRVESTVTLIAQLPYTADSAALFEAVADSPWSVFLDSGRHGSTPGRYDIIAADPWATVVTRGAWTEVRIDARVERHPDDPFAVLRAVLGPARPAAGPAPFCGGAIGYFGYDLGRRIERLPAVAADDERLPQLAVGLYDWAVVVDHGSRSAWIASSGRIDATRSRWPALVRRFESAGAERARSAFRTRPGVASSMTRAQYEQAFERIRRYIVDGDCYQVNLAQRFEAQAFGDPWRGYLALRALSPAPHAAYLNLPFAQVMSVSPERFLQVRNRQVETRPIKGTRARAGDPQLDAERARALAASPKDRAENLMIVDLLRNDLAKNCRLGSVHVPRLFAVESFAGVHHLVSTVRGELGPGRDALDLLRGCFPGGSITGAPKVRAMQIIENLEPHRRGVYCGSIGYLGHDGAMDTSIAIRTLVYRAGTARYWAGGGIVADSVAADEYQECLDKASCFFELVRRCAAGSDSS